MGGDAPQLQDMPATNCRCQHQAVLQTSRGSKQDAASPVFSDRVHVAVCRMCMCCWLLSLTPCCCPTFPRVMIVQAIKCE